jgi:hypothetical protein
MKNLSLFAPAETLLLLKGKNVKLKDLLKVTLMDLFLKQALRTIEIVSPSTSKSLSVPNTYVVSGTNLNHYSPMTHEHVFLSPFYKNTEMQILFNNMVKIGYQNAKTEKRYSNLIFKNKNLNRYFQQGFITIFKGRFSLTPSGERMAQDLKAEINDLESTLPNLMENEKSRALEIMKTLGGNIFLLKGVDLNLMKQIENYMVMADTRDKNYSSSASATSDTMIWIALDSHARDFDNGCSNSSGNDSGWGDSGAGDSGGDSGCSGCGGCGGD